MLGCSRAALRATVEPIAVGGGASRVGGGGALTNILDGKALSFPLPLDGRSFMFASAFVNSAGPLDCSRRRARDQRLRIGVRIG